MWLLQSGAALMGLLDPDGAIDGLERERVWVGGYAVVLPEVLRKGGLVGPVGQVDVVAFLKGFEG